jgi:putative transcriptional regulator
MGIRVHLDRVMLERGISLTELAGRVGLTLANLSILKSNKAKAIRFSTLGALCKELQCSPGDILKYEMRAEETEGSDASL